MLLKLELHQVPRVILHFKRVYEKSNLCRYQFYDFQSRKLKVSHKWHYIDENCCCINDSRPKIDKTFHNEIWDVQNKVPDPQDNILISCIWFRWTVWEGSSRSSFNFINQIDITGDYCRTFFMYTFETMNLSWWFT